MLPLLAFGLTCYFAVVLGVAGLAKLDQPDVFANSLRQYRLLPYWSLNPISRVVPWVELAASVALITGMVARATTLFVCALFAVFFALKGGLPA